MRKTNIGRARDEAVASVAKTVLEIPTLEVRNSDSLDFHEVPVWMLKAALKAAYDAGRRARG